MPFVDRYSQYISIIENLIEELRSMGYVDRKNDNGFRYDFLRISEAPINFRVRYVFADFDRIMYYVLDEEFEPIYEKSDFEDLDRRVKNMFDYLIEKHGQV